MRKNFHNFSPGSSAMAHGLRIHSSENENKREDHRQPATAVPTEEIVPAEQIEETPAEEKIHWRPVASLRWRFARR